MVRNYRGRSSRGMILCVPNGCQLRGRGPKVRCLARLGSHTNLDWARRVCVYFGVGITTVVIKWEFVSCRQADQASTEPRGTHTRGSMSVGEAIARGTEHPYVRVSCTCLSTPLNERSGWWVNSGRSGKVRGVGEMEWSQGRSSISYLCVGEPSRSRGRWHLERTWSAGVGVTRERGAILHGRGGHQGRGRARGARGRERLSRSCGEVCRGGGPTTVTLRGRRRSSVMGAGGTTPRRSASAVTLMPAVGGTAAPATHSFFPCLEHRAVSVMGGKLGIEERKYIREGGRAPTEAVFGRAVVTTAAAILYTRLTTGVLSEKGRPQG